MGAFKKRRLGRIFEFKRGSERRMQESTRRGIHTSFSSPRIRIIESRKIRRERRVVSMGQMGNAYKILIRNFERTTLEIYRWSGA